jgi:hypothetical protein
MENEVQPQAREIPNADKAVGLALQVLACVFLLACIAAYAIVGSAILDLSTRLNPSTATQPTIFVPGQPPAPVQSPVSDTANVITGILIIFLLLLVGFLIYVGSNIKESKKWAFGASLVIATVSALIGNLAFVAVPIMVYCVFRLNGKLGPVPA